MAKKLVLIDGHSILNRAFYGVPDLTNALGMHTNAVYGFLNIMFHILEEEQPQYLAVAFDVNAPTFRHKMYREYKGTRKPMPAELREQVPLIKEVLGAMQITMVEQAGLEADDVLGTLAKKGEKDGLEVSLISGDRDLLQIASGHIKIRIPKTKMGKTEIEDYYAEDVQNKYQVTPEQFIELKALMGDTADNIPGVPKVGEKTAVALMLEYGSLENIFANRENVTKKSIRESLEENEELAWLSKKLATIRTDCDLALDYEKSKAEGYFTKEAYEIFKKLEFKNMLKYFSEDHFTDRNSVTDRFRQLDEPAQVEEWFAGAMKADKAGFFILRDKETVVGASFALPAREIVFIPVQGFISEDYLRSKICKLSAAVSLYTFDIKKEYDFLDRDDTGHYFDILIGAYLLNPLKNDYEAEDIAAEYMDLLIPGRKEVFGKLTASEMYGKEPEKCREFACYEAYVSLEATDIIRNRLKETGMLDLMEKIEMPLSLVLYDMEKEGILVRPEALKEYGEHLEIRIRELEQEIYHDAGTEFNLNSPKQLGEILFVRMGIPGGKKTKTGYSTAADILEKLAPDYPVINKILEYRGLAKLKSTYADGLSAFIGEDNRIHSNFNQTITATGRISSTEPNLQNIPMRLEIGRQIRKVFVPKEKCIFMDADYSQIELRVLAHMSGDSQLIGAYRMDSDIHRITASKVFHTPFDEVTDLQRRNAKAVNFGIVYGISSFGLSQDLSITRKEAANYIEQYFATYPDVKIFLDRLVADAKKNGYAVTMFGRRRPIPELSSGNFMQRSFGERVAMNSPIQGTAADIIKIAMIRVWSEMKKAGLKSKLILQVHDELLVETYEEEEEKVREILTKEMKSAAVLAVKLEIDLHTGKNWYEAK